MIRDKMCKKCRSRFKFDRLMNQDGNRLYMIGGAVVGANHLCMPADHPLDEQNSFSLSEIKVHLYSNEDGALVAMAAVAPNGQLVSAAVVPGAPLTKVKKDTMLEAYDPEEFAKMVTQCGMQYVAARDAFKEEQS